MGLNILAISKTSCTNKHEYCNRCEKQNHIEVHLTHDIPDRLDGKQCGCYVSTGKQFEFSAGLSSVYNDWRDKLCKLILEVSTKEVWSNPELYEDKPFIELICFPDNEGAIGSETSKKLAIDFKNFSKLIELNEDSEFKTKYLKWQRAFEIASDDGFVVFM